MVTFLFSVNTITEAKQYVWLGRVEPGQWIFQPGHLTWCSAATDAFSTFVCAHHRKTPESAKPHFLQDACPF